MQLNITGQLIGIDVISLSYDTESQVEVKGVRL